MKDWALITSQEEISLTHEKRFTKIGQSAAFWFLYKSLFGQKMFVCVYELIMIHGV